MTKQKQGRFSPEVRERAIRLVREQTPQHTAQWAAITAIAPKLGCTKETLRRWVREAERETGQRPGPTRAEEDRVKALERDVCLRGRRACHLRGRADLPRVAIAPSSYYAHNQAEANPGRRSARRQRDEALTAKIDTVYRANYEVYGARKVWHQLRQDGEPVARCTVERLMRAAGLEGVVRGGRVRTTRPSEDPAAVRQGLVQRQFAAERPNQLWLAYFTYVATWRGFVYVAFVYVAFVIDAFSRRIVGWATRRAQLLSSGPIRSALLWYRHRNLPQVGVATTD